MKTSKNDKEKYPLNNIANSLAEAVRKGGSDGEEAFEKLLALYQPLIKSVASSFSDSAEALGNTNCYSDICQELTMALYKAALKFDSSQIKVTFGKYAKVCLTNKAISILRKQKSAVNKENKMKKQMEEKLKHQGRETNPFAALPEKEKDKLLNEVALELSPFELKVFKKYLDGMKAKEIAAELTAEGGAKGNTEKSVNNAVYRTKVKAKKVYCEKFFNNF